MTHDESEDFETTWRREMGRIEETRRTADLDLDWQAQQLAKKELGPAYRHCFPPKGADTLVTYRRF